MISQKLHAGKEIHRDLLEVTWLYIKICDLMIFDIQLSKILASIYVLKITIFHLVFGSMP